MSTIYIPHLRRGLTLTWAVLAVLLDFRRTEEASQQRVRRQTLFPSENTWRVAMCQALFQAEVETTSVSKTDKNLLSKEVGIIVGED